MLNILILSLFCVHSTSSVEIEYQPLANILLQAIDNFTSIIQEGQSEVNDLLNFETSSNKIQIAPELAHLPTTINFLVKALDEFRYFFLRLFNGLNSIITENKSQVTGLAINIPIEVLQPYLNGYKQVANDILTVSNQIQVFISLITTFINPQNEESQSGSHAMLSIPASFDTEYNQTIKALATAFNNSGIILLNVAQQSTQAISQLSAPGIAGSVMSSINTFTQIVGQNFVYFGNGITGQFGTSSIIQEVSSNTYNFSAQTLLIRLNSVLEAFKIYLVSTVSYLSKVGGILYIVANI